MSRLSLGKKLPNLKKLWKSISQRLCINATKDCEAIYLHDLFLEPAVSDDDFELLEWSDIDDLDGEEFSEDEEGDEEIHKVFIA
jgi:hypothetical protein